MSSLNPESYAKLKEAANRKEEAKKLAQTIRSFQTMKSKLVVFPKEIFSGNSIQTERESDQVSLNKRISKTQTLDKIPGNPHRSSYTSSISLINAKH